MARSKRKRTGSKVRQHLEFLSYLKSIPPRRQKLLLKNADSEILSALSELCLNLLMRNCPLTNAQIKKLIPYEKQIYQMSLKKNSAVHKKRLVQRGGFISALLTTVLPALISSIVAATAK